MAIPATSTTIERNTPRWRKQALLYALRTSFVAASKKFRIARSALYKFHERVRDKPEQEWEALLADHRRGPKPNQPSVVRRQERRAQAVLKVSAEQPASGCNRLQAVLRKRGVEASHQTIQKILTDAGRGSREDRWLALDCPGMELSKAQREFLETMNPALRDVDTRGDRPRKVLHADRIELRSVIPGLKSARLYIVIDSYSGKVFARLAERSADGQWLALFNEGVLPWLQQRLNARNSITVHVRKNTLGGEADATKNMLGEKEIKLARPAVTSGLVERFVRCVTTEFRLSDEATEPFDSVEQARPAFARWLARYNARAHDGYPTYGKSPDALHKAFFANGKTMTKAAK